MKKDYSNLGHPPSAKEAPREKAAAVDAWAKTGDKEKEPSRRLTVDLPISLHRRIKTACVANDENMTEVVTQILLEKYPQPPAA